MLAGNGEDTQIMEYICAERRTHKFSQFMCCTLLARGTDVGSILQ